MRNKRVLFICGSLNQTTQMHQIAAELPECETRFTPYYADGFLDLMRRLHLVEFTILGNKLARRCLSYLRLHDLPVDEHGRQGPYDLVVTCSDLIMPRAAREAPSVLVQEGMTDPENMAYHLVRTFPLLPRWLASTSTMGLSHLYSVFCVASDGYRDHFIRKGVSPRKIEVTGIPNFDNCRRYLQNDFPHRGYVLVCTSDARETFKWENRRKLILQAVRTAAGRQLIFKLHPNENARRAGAEIRRWAPGALVYATGNTEQMIANCDVLITQYSSVVYVGLALGKEVYSRFDVEELRRLTPAQNSSAARNIAGICRRFLGIPAPEGKAAGPTVPAIGFEATSPATRHPAP
ncbi:MAG: hypothetical protein WB626_03325 [Bacteroidota bacterium]